MLKEIHEQASALADTIGDRTARGVGVDLADPGVLDESILDGLERVTIVSCGTSYHAGLLGRYAIEEWARMRVEVDVASEYRYRNPIVSADDLVVGITQSGETADTLAAMRLARERGGRVLALTNAMGSQATRDADARALHARRARGRRRGDQDVRLPGRRVYLLALRLAELRGTLAAGAHRGARRRRCGRCRRSSRSCSRASQPEVEAIAEWCWEAPFFLYIGRQAAMPIALEGALKLKEISYVSTDAYAAGEMKHGPIALLDEQTPVVCVATSSAVLREGRTEHPGGAGARREGDRDHHRGRRRRSPRTPTRRSPCPRPTSCSRRCSR